MGHTNATVNYNLPQFIGTDKPSWLGDVNDAFSDIDTAIAAAKSVADTASTGVGTLNTTVGGHTTQLGTLSNSVTSQGNTLNTVTALIGNGTPTTTDQTIIGAINELDGRTKSVKIAEAAGNQTYGQQLTALQSAFNALTADQKLRTHIRFQGGYIAPYSNTQYDLHTCMQINQNVGFEAWQFSISNVGASDFTTSTGVITDLTNVTDSEVMELWLN